MKKLTALLTIAFLTAACLTWAAAEDDEEDREDREDDGGDDGGAQIRTVITETVYLPDPETEKKLADALAEVDRLKIELALTNTTLQYALDEGEALRGELDAAKARISRLNSDVSVLRSYEERKPTLDTTEFMDIYGNDTWNEDTESPEIAAYPQPAERPFPFSILALFNLL